LLKYVPAAPADGKNAARLACGSRQSVNALGGKMNYVHPTILVIDDQPDARAGLEIMLRRDGYTVETAANGREALDKLWRGLRPCIILMDLMMPVMTGYEFRQEQMEYPESETSRSSCIPP
jgi:CheY-like chemotaxis protein